MLETVTRPEIIVPLGAFLVAIVAIVCSMIAKMHRYSTQARLVEMMIGKGMSPEEIRRVLSSQDGESVLDDYQAKQGMPRPLASK